MRIKTHFPLSWSLTKKGSLTHFGQATAHAIRPRAQVILLRMFANGKSSAAATQWIGVIATQAIWADYRDWNNAVVYRVAT